MVPSRKRLDLALDVLEELRLEDDRYLLFIKSGMPWEHWWVWQHPAEREHYASALRRVQRSALLRGAVVFDDAGPDVAAWCGCPIHVAGAAWIWHSRLLAWYWRCGVP